MAVAAGGRRSRSPTSSPTRSVRSFLYGRLDDQLDVAQQQAYQYLTVVRPRAERPGTATRSARSLRADPARRAGVARRLRHGARPTPARSSSRAEVDNPDPRPVLRRLAASPPRSRATPLRGAERRLPPEPNSVGRGRMGDPGVRYREPRSTCPRASSWWLPRSTRRAPRCRRCSGSRSAPRWRCWPSCARSCCGRCAAACGRSRTWPRRPRPSPAATSRSGSRWDEPSEVGRLGRALNAMLARIEAAFAEKSRVRAPAAPVRGRRLPRAAHPAHVDPRLRRAAAQGGVRRRRRPAAGPAPGRAGGEPHGPARRRPAPPGPPRPGPPARPGGRRPAPGRRRRGRRRPGGRPEPSGRARLAPARSS